MAWRPDRAGTSWRLSRPGSSRVRAPTGDTCDLVQRAAADPAKPRTLATLPIACPPEWRIGRHATQNRWLLTVGSYAAFRTFSVDLDAGSAGEVQAPAGELEFMAFAGDIVG